MPKSAEDTVSIAHGNCFAMNTFLTLAHSQIYYQFKNNDVYDTSW